MESGEQPRADEKYGRKCDGHHVGQRRSLGSGSLAARCLNEIHEAQTHHARKYDGQKGGNADRQSRILQYATTPEDREKCHSGHSQQDHRIADSELTRLDAGNHGECDNDDKDHGGKDVEALEYEHPIISIYDTAS